MVFSLRLFVHRTLKHNETIVTSYKANIKTSCKKTIRTVSYALKKKRFNAYLFVVFYIYPIDTMINAGLFGKSRKATAKQGGAKMRVQTPSTGGVGLEPAM